MAKLASACLATLSAETVRVQLPSAPSNLRNAGWIQIQIIGSESVVTLLGGGDMLPVTGVASSALDSLYSVKLQKDTEPKSKVYENISLFILWLE